MKRSQRYGGKQLKPAHIKDDHQNVSTLLKLRKRTTDNTHNNLNSHYKAYAQQFSPKNSSTHTKTQTPERLAIISPSDRDQPQPASDLLPRGPLSPSRGPIARRHDQVQRLLQWGREQSERAPHATRREDLGVCSQQRNRGCRPSGGAGQRHENAGDATPSRGVRHAFSG